MFKHRLTCAFGSKSTKSMCGLKKIDQVAEGAHLILLIGVDKLSGRRTGYTHEHSKQPPERWSQLQPKNCRQHWNNTKQEASQKNKDSGCSFFPFMSRPSSSRHCWTSSAATFPAIKTLISSTSQTSQDVMFEDLRKKMAKFI